MLNTYDKFTLFQLNCEMAAFPLYFLRSLSVVSELHDVRAARVIYLRTTDQQQ